MKALSFLEVGPRDGLQNEKKILSLKDKIEFTLRLAQTGLKRIELGAFVSPRWSPQMETTGRLAAHILQKQEKGDLDKSLQFSALVPNQKGLEKALLQESKRSLCFYPPRKAFPKKISTKAENPLLRAIKSFVSKLLGKGLKSEPI